MQTYYIIKGTKKVDSFYLNEHPIKFVYDKNKCEIVEKISFTSMFPIRKNSNIFFKEFTEAKNYIEYAKESIKNDERFCNKIKNELLNYIQTFKIITN